MFWLFTIFVAASVLRFAPGGEGHMAMGVATPIALYGFIMAATWIDYVADHLVSLLDFMGIVLHIPVRLYYIILYYCLFYYIPLSP